MGNIANSAGCVSSLIRRHIYGVMGSTMHLPDCVLGMEQQVPMPGGRNVLGIRNTRTALFYNWVAGGFCSFVFGG